MTDPIPLRVVIADDEAPSLALLERLLGAAGDIEIVAACSNGIEALEAIRKTAPDAAFLDIRMPGLQGLAVSRALAPDNAPLIVFVTAYDSHAVDAFDVRAFDYIMKPIDKSRFARTVLQVRAAIQNRRMQKLVGDLANLVSPPPAAAGPTESEDAFLRVRAGDRLQLVPVRDVHYFQAANQYVRLIVGDQEYLISTESLNTLEARLDPAHFFRIHRSTIVNLDFVADIRTPAGGGRQVRLESGIKLPASRRSNDRIRALMIALANR